MKDNKELEEIKLTEKRFFEKSDSQFTKTKGIGKLLLGLAVSSPVYTIGLFVTQPYSTLFLGGLAFTTAFGVRSYQHLMNEYGKKDITYFQTFGLFFKDLFSGKMNDVIKDAGGMGIGSTISLFFPAAGLVMAGAGAISFIARNPSGIDGIFKGGLVATAVGAYALPALGAAIFLEGAANSLGYECRLISKGYELSKSAIKGVFGTINLAEKNKDKPAEAVKPIANSLFSYFYPSKEQQEKQKTEHMISPKEKEQFFSAVKQTINEGTTSKQQEKAEEVTQKTKSLVSNLYETGKGIISPSSHKESTSFLERVSSGKSEETVEKSEKATRSWTQKAEESGKSNQQERK